VVKVTEQVSVYANYIEGLSKGAMAPMTAANYGDVFAPYKTKQKEVGLKLDLGTFTQPLPGSFVPPAAPRSGDRYW
jgi:iron complex outermembrane receptor protein